MSLNIARSQLAELLLQPVPLADVSKLSDRDLLSALDYFGDELDKAEELDAEAWQAKYEDLLQSVGDQLQTYAEELADGDLTAAQFRRQVENTLRSAYSKAYQMGPRCRRVSAPT